MTLGIYWRGPLDSCNYGCAYCPFAKRRPTNLDVDRAALDRFVAWALQAPRRLRILFTPYGEALIWPWYQEAIVRLSHAPNVDCVGIQTNLSGALDFLRRADRVMLWASFHPTETALDPFVARVRATGGRCTVGVVSHPDHLEIAEALRAALPDVPFWVNAAKPGFRYPPGHKARWTALDPRFPLDLRPHASRGQPCRTGEDVIFVDGDGVVRRCHFVDTPLGDLYGDPLASMLAPRPCPRARCDCWIGYAHLPALGLPDPIFRGLSPRS